MVIRVRARVSVRARVRARAGLGFPRGMVKAQGAQPLSRGALRWPGRGG